ncbi:MAG: DUF2723 domain-containing protein [Bacteroidales bacterium]|nr:DUF2723 domain-containing protein [Bacteroidales bacterium]
MEKKYKILNNLLGFLSFIGASIVYILTIEPTVSLWDCGEFIATAGKLEVGHPPGAPFFLLLGRFFSLFASSPEQIAACVNTMSALASGATIMFLFWTITHLAKKFFTESELNITNIILILSAGLIGAGAYTFTDTFWFSAVEGEVYGMSSLLTAVVFWAILKWEDHFDEPGSDRWIIFIAYIMGLSIGVHLLNLLTITAIVFVYYFKKFQPTLKGIILTCLLSFLFIAFMMWGIIAGSVDVASSFELFCVNILGMPYQSGLILWLIVLTISFIAGIIVTQKDNLNKWIKVGIVTFITILLGIPTLTDSPIIWIIILAGIIWGLQYANKQNKYILNTLVNVLMVIMIGYSSYAMIIIRSNAETPMNENAPKDAFSLLSYLNREQYGSTPIIYGPYYNASPVWKQDGSAEVKEKFTYTPRDGKYVKVSNGLEYVWNPDQCTLFPRMYSREAHHVRGYKDWAGIKDGVNTKKVRYDREGKTYDVPTFGQNLRYFFSYQIGHMYMRYFMWNFCGRQNDIQGHGDIEHGNWITGINFIDKQLVGDQSQISEKAKTTPSRNVYYMLPLLLGLIGLIYHLSRRKDDSFVVILLFLMTGLAIIVYLNQKPYEPRERDYAYAGSFYAYCIWIGLSVLAIFELIKNIFKNNQKIGAIAGIAVALLITIPAPVLLATENWDDHDRSGRYTAHDFAYNYLQSCDPNSMIVTAGDNDTFPLWYIQEIEGVRTDVRVLCTPLLATDWYSQQMKHRAYESAPLPMKLTEKQVGKGIRDMVPVREFGNQKGKFVSLHEAMEVVRDDNMLINYYGDKYNYFPAKNLKFSVDKEVALANNAVSQKDTNQIVDEISFTLKDNNIYKNKLVIYDCLDGWQWDRPLYFTSQSSAEDLGLESYLRYDGFAFKFVPVKNEDARVPYIDTDVLYDKLMNVYKWRGMGEKGVYIDHFHERTTRVIGIRQMFNSLAFELIAEHKLDSAQQVLNKLDSLMPDWQIPYFDESIISTSYAYYMIKDFESGNRLLKTYAENLMDEIEWYNSLKDQPTFFKRIEASKIDYMRTVIRIYQVAQQYKQTALCNELDLRWNELGEYPITEYSKALNR